MPQACFRGADAGEDAGVIECDRHGCGIERDDATSIAELAHGQE